MIRIASALLKNLATRDVYAHRWPFRGRRERPRGCVTPMVTEFE